MLNSSTHNRFKLLLVDDDAGTLSLLRSIFDADSRFEVTSCANGDEALKLCHTERPDVVLLDVMLPGQNGYAVCRLIKHDLNCRDTKVLFLSAANQHLVLESGRKVGADGFVAKPFTIDGLLQAVEEHLPRAAAA
jgi:CheY-like chemotaxis protein